MQEIKITGNKSGLRVLVDEPLDVGLLHNDDFNVWASALDLTLSEHRQNYYKYKSRDKLKVKEVGIAAGEKGNECLAVCECVLELIHGYPPLCSGRWRHNPCRHGRKR